MSSEVPLFMLTWVKHMLSHTLKEKNVGIIRTLHPSWYQRNNSKKAYFEGWYFKMASSTVLAVIPGVSQTVGKDDSHAFIQVISSNPCASWYIRFPIEEFHAEKDQFSITIGKNSFSLEGIALAIEQPDIQLHGTVTHLRPRTFPVTLRSPGIMGWYAYVPFMECFHGVVSMHHELRGTLDLNGQRIELSDGEGYIEKDWGQSFPSAWIWMQCNSFPSKDVSCMISVARIPFLGRSFTGFLGFISIGDRLIRFATYTGARIIALESDRQHCRVAIQSHMGTIEFIGSLGTESQLTAPKHGSMGRTITESIMGSIRVSFADNTGTWIFAETGNNAGIELSEADSLRP